MKKLNKITISITLILLVCSTVILARNDKITVTYSSPVDGDTAKFVIDQKITTVRFLGIDTPETVHPTKKVEPYGPEASEFTKNSLENATKIVLEYDDTAQEQDKYGRPLVWVWIDDVLLQEQLIQNGLAQTYMLPKKSKYTNILNAAQEEAKAEKIGKWSNETYIFPEENTTNTIDTHNDTDNFTGEDIIIAIATIVLAIILYLIKLLKKPKSKKR